MDGGQLARLTALLGAGITDARSLGGQHGVRHYRLTLAGGRRAFAKIHDPCDRNVVTGFAAERHGLRWLAEPGAAAIPAVLAADDHSLVIEWIDELSPGQAAAQNLGRSLARLHAAGPDRFGASWPGVIAGLPLPSESEPGESWPQWYAARRVLPYVRIARDAGALSAADAGVLEAAAARAAAVSSRPEKPARLHGDLWSGNILWSAGSAWLIDPAAHGGHRETDLAMLALFGVPYLDRILAAYQEVAPLADGWRQRVPLHQLHPLLVHVCLFGGAYRDSALAAARQVLAM